MVGRREQESAHKCLASMEMIGPLGYSEGNPFLRYVKLPLAIHKYENSRTNSVIL